MADAAGITAWIGLGAGSLALVTAALKLATDLIGQRRGPPETVTREMVPPERLMASQYVVLPGRSTFINRRREIQELVSKVRMGHDNVLAIEGDRWVGKSATATEVAHRLLSEPAAGAFDPKNYNFLWIDASYACPTLSDICGRLSRLTDDQSLSVVAEEHKGDGLRLHLATRKTVLVLDNLVLSDDTRSQKLIDFLDTFPSGSLVIASVNRPGRLAAARVPLDELDERHVRRLIADRIDHFQLDGLAPNDDAFAARLHQLLGGNPGMIEWFLRGYRQTSESIEERVAQIERGHGLSELFEPTWILLDDLARDLLMACAVLGGRATAQQFACASGHPPEIVSHAVDRLHRDGLVGSVRATGRATVYTSARAFQLFASSKIPAGTHDEMIARLADHYLEHFTANREDAHYAAGEIEALRTTREGLFDAYDDARVQALFWVTLDLFFTLGQFDELIAAADLSFRSADRSGNFGSAALAAAIKACTHAIRGEEGAAWDAYAHAALAAERSGLPGPLARAGRCRAFLLYRSGKPEDALGAIEGVEDLARRCNDLSTVVDTFDLRSAAYWHLGDLDACEAAARASLATGEEIRWERARAFPLRYLADIALQRRNPGEALGHLSEARAVATRFGDMRQLARIDVSEARFGLLEGDLDRASQAVARALAETTRLGLPPEHEEAAALAKAVARARRSRLWRRHYARRRPMRLSEAPVGGD